MATRNGGGGIEGCGGERVAVLHHDRRRALSRDERRLQPFRAGHFWDGRPRQDQGRRQDDVHRHHGLVRGTLLAAIALIALGAAACGYADPYATSGPVANESPLPAASPTPSPGADNFNDGVGLPVVTYPDGLQYIDIKVGTGKVAEMNLMLPVEYPGGLSAATNFDPAEA